MDNNKGGENRGGRKGGLGWWGGVDRKGRKLYLDSNKNVFKKESGFYNYGIVF